MDTIIGLIYYAFDGSWSKCLTGEYQFPVCAPMNDFLLTPLTILSEPFDKRIDWNGLNETYPFIRVCDSYGHEYECIYHPRFIVRTIEDSDRIKRHANMCSEMESGIKPSMRRNFLK